LRASVDGLALDGSAVVEIKCGIFCTTGVRSIPATSRRWLPHGQANTA